MTATNSLPDSTPILVGAGQTVEREAAATSPLALASRAANLALQDCAATADVAAQIDTIAVVRLFSDMTKQWACPFGRSNNPPQSIASAIGATPKSSIYTESGGNVPQSLVIEFARDIARGDKSLVLLAGSEAIRNQRSAERAGTDLDWNEEFDQPLEDRGFGKMVATNQERKNGMIMPMFYYAQIEQAQAVAKGRSTEEHRAAMAQLLASFAAVAADNPYAQFPGSQSTADILDAAPLTNLYSKRMIAQDSVNQAAAVLMCSVAKARELGIPEDRWVFIHGMAEGMELMLSERPDPARSAMAEAVLDQTLAAANKSIADVGPIDIYSCFPCAITAVADHLGLPTDGSRPLTLTGGLPYFGGPGNNYSMHGLAELVWQLRESPEQYGLLTTNGGVLSKHAAGLYSCQPSTRDWATIDTWIDNQGLPRKTIAADPGTGRILSYSVNYRGAEPSQAIILAETDNGERFVACTARDDQSTPTAMLASDPIGRQVSVSPPVEETIHFTLN